MTPVSQSLARHGAILVNTTGLVTARFGTIYAISSIEIEALVSENLPDGTPYFRDEEGSGTINGLDLYAGQSIFGLWSSIKLTSGVCVIYLAER